MANLLIPDYHPVSKPMYYHQVLFSSLLLFFSFSIGFAQGKVNHFSEIQYLEISSENDFYYLGVSADRYFTSGKSLFGQSKGLYKAALGFGQFFPFQGLNKGAINSYQFQFHHQMYRPFRIEWSEPDLIDCPYAALAFLGFYNQSYFQKQGVWLTKRLDLGWIGPAVHGEALQNWFHRLKGRPLARGWDYQIADQLLVGLELQLDKSLFLKESEKKIDHHLRSINKLKWSSLEGNIQLGLSYQMGDLQEQLHPEKGYRKGWSWYTFFDASLRLVAYNQLISGRLQPSVSDQTLIFEDLHPLTVLWRIWLCAQKG